MTDKTDLKQLAEQMAKHVSSFEDIKAFQKQLMQSFIDTALESEMEEHLGYAKHEQAKPTVVMVISKRPYKATRASLKLPPQETERVNLNLS